MKFSLSQISYLRLYPSFNFEDLKGFSNQYNIFCFDIVPSYMLGLNWDIRLINHDMKIYNEIDLFKSCFNSNSIQSLTYGLNLCLFNDLTNDDSFHIRIKALALLANKLKVNRFVLGSPNDKKIPDNYTAEVCKSNFLKNISFALEVFQKFCKEEFFLCIEHNTIQQGAELINTLNEFVYLLKIKNCYNLQLNLDSQCLFLEFGSYDLNSLIKNLSIDDIGFIQLGNDLFNTTSSSNLSKFLSLSECKKLNPCLEFSELFSKAQLLDAMDTLNLY